MKISKTLNGWAGAARAAILALFAALALLPPLQVTAREAQRPETTPTVRSDTLPAEVRETLRLIERGGPFRYRKDGSVFGNRERLLPERPRGYYREYTVRTPGERDRGARRIVTGRGGERYYTADHYRSFRRIVP